MTVTREQIRNWLKDELAKKGHGSKAELAELLGVRNDAITRMTNDDGKEVREILAHEFVAMIHYFRSMPDGM